MHSNNNTASLYETLQVTAGEGRSLEAAVLLKAANKLQHALDEWDHIQNHGEFSCLTEALRYNQKLWTVLQVDLASEDSPLPPELRRSLFILSRFVDRCTFQLLAAPERERVAALIQINRNLAEGLGTPPPRIAEEREASLAAAASTETETFDLTL